MGQSVNLKSAAGDYSQKSAESYTQCLARRKQAYANAYGLEENSRQQAYIAGQQMQTMRQNQTAELTAARVINAASGFNASGGSKLQQEMSTAQMFEEAISNASKSYAITDQNARNQANQLRKEGDDAYKYGEIMSNYFSKASKLNSRAVNWTFGMETLSTIGDLMSTYNLQSNWANSKTKSTKN